MLQGDQIYSQKKKQTNLKHTLHFATFKLHGTLSDTQIETEVNEITVLKVWLWSAFQNN